MMPKDVMRAVVIDRFGGPETLSVITVPVPEPKPDRILIRVVSAGIGRWDIAEREGMIAQMNVLFAIKCVSCLFTFLSSLDDLMI